MEVIYQGARWGNDDKLSYLYNVVGSDRQLWFKKQLPGWHRVGDVLTLAEPKPGSWRVEGGVVRHVESPTEEAEDKAARAHAQTHSQAKKAAERSDLLEALEPLQRAYRRVPAPQRAALITWVVRTMMGWK